MAPSPQEKELRRRLDAWINGRTQAQAAKALGMSQPYLSFILRGYRPVSGCRPILKKLGLEVKIVRRSP